MHRLDEQERRNTFSCRGGGNGNSGKQPIKTQDLTNAGSLGKEKSYLNLDYAYRFDIF